MDVKGRTADQNILISGEGGNRIVSNNIRFRFAIFFQSNAILRPRNKTQLSGSSLSDPQFVL
jgi:hypothetical protein